MVGMFSYQDMTNLEILKQRRNLYLKAERDILSGQTVEIEGMRITRADLETVRRMINNLTNEIAEMSRGKRRPRIRIGVPM